MGDEQKKIRVVFLTDCLVDLTGGAEKQIFELAKGLDKKKHDVTIASLECGGLAPCELIEAAGCRLASFPVKRIYGLSGILEGFRFIRFLRKSRVDIIMTYHFSSDIWGTVMAKIAGVPVIISNRRDMGFWRKWMHILAYKIVNRYVNKVIVNARPIKELFLRQEGFDEKKVEVIQNGIDLLDPDLKLPVTKLRNELGIKKNDCIVIHVANIRPVKGHDYLIRAFSKVVTPHPSTKLLLIGEDKLNGQMKDLAEKLGIKKNVVFLGKRDDARSLLRLADICVLPSISEGMSNAIMEYMEAGKPVIATRVGGNPELVDDGVNGLLVEKEDPEGLEKALLSLIQHSEKRVAMGEKGYQKISNKFSMQKMVKNYESVFMSFVTGKWKILHLISSVGLFGAENIVLTLGQNIQDRNRVSVIGVLADTRGDPRIELIERARELGVETCSIKCQGRFDIGAIFRLKKYLTQGRIDILHTHNYKSDIIGALAARTAGVPVVATAHGFTDMTRTVSVYEKLDRWVLKSFFKSVVTVTDKMLPGFPQKIKHVIPNGVNVARFSRDAQKGAALRKKFNIKEDDILVGTIGRLSREKNQKLFLEALYPVMRDNENVKVIIVGTGPEEDELKQFGQARHLDDRIIFTGLMYDTVSAYSAMDIFVLSSRTEGVPLTVLEAMASKLPVIATRVGGIPDIISDNETGLLVDPQDADALKTKIEGLVNDADKRRQLAGSAYLFIKTNYSLERMCDAYKRVYKEVLDTRQKT